MRRDVPADPAKRVGTSGGDEETKSTETKEGVRSFRVSALVSNASTWPLRGPGRPSGRPVPGIRWEPPVSGNPSRVGHATGDWEWLVLVDGLDWLSMSWSAVVPRSPRDSASWGVSLPIVALIDVPQVPTLPPESGLMCSLSFLDFCRWLMQLDEDEVYLHYFQLG